MSLSPSELDDLGVNHDEKVKEWQANIECSLGRVSVGYTTTMYMYMSCG